MTGGQCANQNRGIILHKPAECPREPPSGEAVTQPQPFSHGLHDYRTRSEQW